MSRSAARPSPPAIFAALLFTSAAVAALPAGCARESPCELNSDCPVGFCQDGVCKRECADAERDCPPGYTCTATAQCVPGASASSSSGSSSSGGGSSSSSSGMGGSSSSSSGASSSSGSSSTSASSSSGSSSSGGPATKHELDACGGDAECAAPLVCRSMASGEAKRCTRLCASTGQCMTGTICHAIGNEQYCAADDTGRSCTDGSTCNFACLTAQQYCTKQCIAGADCPNGYGCMTVQGFDICVKAEEPCATGAAAGCIAPAACDESPTMVVGGCTLVCSTSADCPQRAAGLAPWTCDAGGICRRPADVFGPLETGWHPAQYACNAQAQVVNVCNDGFHIDLASGNVPSPPPVSCGATMTTDGIPATDSCIDSCRYQGGCPYGNACVALGNVGSARLGLCFPTGAGEVGSLCSNNIQCLFGYCNNGTCSRDCTADGVCPNGTACIAGGGPAVEGQPFKRCQ